MGKNENSFQKVLVIAIIAGVLGGGIAAYGVVSYKESQPKTQEQLIKGFYDVENAVHVSPHGLRKHLGEDDAYILVDLRSQEEYEEEHITGAVNIPAYTDRDHSDYGAVDRIVSSFKALREASPEKDVIIYCYSASCMTGRKVGKILADHGIYVKHLGIGWNEWRYAWTSFNHPHEWNNTSAEQYITSGPEPGSLKAGITVSGCPVEGGLGC